MNSETKEKIAQITGLFLHGYKQSGETDTTVMQLPEGLGVIAAAVSGFTGHAHAMHIPNVTIAEIRTWQEADSGDAMAYVQNALPNLTRDQAEFLKTGVTPEEWDIVFGDIPSDEKDIN